GEPRMYSVKAALRRCSLSSRGGTTRDLRVRSLAALRRDPPQARDDLLAAHGRVWRSFSGRRSELVFQRPGGELGTSVEAELVHDLEHVRLSRALGDRQLLSNLAIGQASGKQSRDFLFTSGEPLRVETDERRRRGAGRAALRAFAGWLFRRRLGRLLDGRRGGNCVFESHDASF